MKSYEVITPLGMSFFKEVSREYEHGIMPFGHYLINDTVYKSHIIIGGFVKEVHRWKTPDFNIHHVNSVLSAGFIDWVHHIISKI